MDGVEVALITSAVSVVSAIALGFVVSFVWNRGSRNLASAFAALVGGTLVFFTQIYFELQPTVAFESVTTELTIDRARPEIRQWSYHGDTDRIAVEPNASQWLATTNPGAFQRDREKLTKDLILFSLLSFLQTTEAQVWETHRHAIVGRGAATGGIIRFHAYPGRTCRVVREEEMRSELYHSGNLFAGAPFFGNRQICLPPGSNLEIAGSHVIIRNPLCQIAFRIDPTRGASYSNPGQGESLPKLLSGEARFESRAIGMDVETTFFALRAQSSEGPKYHEWVSAVVKGARDWFEN